MLLRKAQVPLAVTKTIRPPCRSCREGRCVYRNTYLGLDPTLCSSGSSAFVSIRDAPDPSANVASLRALTCSHPPPIHRYAFRLRAHCLSARAIHRALSLAVERFLSKRKARAPARRTLRSHRHRRNSRPCGFSPRALNHASAPTTVAISMVSTSAGLWTHIAPHPRPLKMEPDADRRRGHASAQVVQEGRPAVRQLEIESRIGVVPRSSRRQINGNSVTVESQQSRIMSQMSPLHLGE